MASDEPDQSPRILLVDCDAFFVQVARLEDPDGAGKVDLLLASGETGKISLQFAPAPRQRIKTGNFDLSTLELTGTTARGIRLAPKPVKSLKYQRREVGSKKKTTRKKVRIDQAKQTSLF